MIIAVGDTEIFFKKDDVSHKEILEQLDLRTIRFDVLDYEESRGIEYLSIKFIIQLKENENCKKLDDYVSYAYEDFLNLIPFYTNTHHLKIHKVSTVQNPPPKMKDFADHLKDLYNIRVGVSKTGDRKS